jgi:hypothetical protein
VITLPQLRARWWRLVQAARRWRNAHAGPIIAALLALLVASWCVFIQLLHYAIFGL